MRRDPYKKVPCELPECPAVVRRLEAVSVSIVFDGTRIRGWACNPAHADELRRGWTTRDAYGADFIDTPNPSVKTG